MNSINETQIRSLIEEHENDYWLALANGWGGCEELAEIIVRLRAVIAKAEGKK